MAKILKLNDVIEITALSRSTIYAYIANKKFPAPIQLGTRAVGWLENEIEAFLDERAQLRGGK
jgi:prophage regulatory protein